MLPALNVVTFPPPLRVSQNSDGTAAGAPVGWWGERGRAWRLRLGWGLGWVPDGGGGRVGDIAEYLAAFSATLGWRGLWAGGRSAVVPNVITSDLRLEPSRQRELGQLSATPVAVANLLDGR